MLQRAEKYTFELFSTQSFIFAISELSRAGGETCHKKTRLEAFPMIPKFENISFHFRIDSKLAWQRLVIQSQSPQRHGRVVHSRGCDSSSRILSNCFPYRNLIRRKKPPSVDLRSRLCHPSQVLVKMTVMMIVSVLKILRNLIPSSNSSQAQMAAEQLNGDAPIWQEDAKMMPRTTDVCNVLRIDRESGSVVSLSCCKKPDFRLKVCTIKDIDQSRSDWGRIYLGLVKSKGLLENEREGVVIVSDGVAEFKRSVLISHQFGGLENSFFLFYSYLFWNGNSNPRYGKLHTNIDDWTNFIPLYLLHSRFS